MKTRRLTRTEQTERNRARLLAAARRLFMARGYHGATLEQIAEEAGFSKGVVYSQFTSKADLFMTLLEARIEQRAAQNLELVEDLPGDQAIAALFENAARVARAEPKWGLLVIEFRVHAARDPEVNRRYAAAHARTLDAFTEVVATVYDRAGEEPPFEPRRMAELIMAVGAGTELEQAANPDALEGPFVAEMLTRLFTRPVARRSIA
jgi:AcrR family transcriptional regulator